MARTSNRGNYPTHFPKKAVTEEEPDMTAEERERVAAGRGDAAAQWARENRIRAERMRQSVRSNAYLLVVFTALYLVPLVFANSWHARGLGAAGAGLVFVVAIAIYIKTPGKLRRMSGAEGVAVGVTSMLEFAASLAGLVAGWVAGKWWWLGALLLSSVTLHFVALTVAFRRPIDVFLLPVACVGAAIALSAPAADLWNHWAVAGGLVAGCTAAYSFAMFRSLKVFPGAAS